MHEIKEEEEVSVLKKEELKSRVIDNSDGPTNN
jgi:hypothetical protein